MIGLSLPEVLQQGKLIIHFPHSADRKGDRVSDVLQAALQSPDTTSQVCGTATASWWCGGDIGRELTKSLAQVLALGVQAEVAGGAGLASWEGQTVTTIAGITAKSSDAGATQTGSGLFVTALWEGSLGITEACWQEENEM